VASTCDFFISYANDDKDPDWAEWIAQTLEAEGYSCRLQAWDFGVGSNFVAKMDEYVRDAERLILVLSPAYVVGRPMVLAEWTAKFTDDADGKKRLLIPVMVRKCDVKGLLGPRVYVDVGGLEPDAAREALLEAVRPGRAKSAAVPFPG
jgi:hypothetical protein